MAVLVFNGLKNLGLTAILIVWGLVSLCVLAVPWFFDRVVGPATPLQPPRDPSVIDLATDQYRRFEAPPPAPPRRGSVPHNQRLAGKGRVGPQHDLHPW